MMLFMAKKTDVYADTSAFIAFLDRSDTHHRFFLGLFENPPKIVTTSLVLAEGHGWFLRRYDQHKALEFMNFISEISQLEVLDIGKKEINKSSVFLKKFLDQKLTLTDAVGLFIMNEMKINLCWSTDRHLSLTGARLVIHQT